MHVQACLLLLNFVKVYEEIPRGNSQKKFLEEMASEPASPNIRQMVNYLNVFQSYSKKYNHSTYTSIIIKKIIFFFTVYKNEWKEYKF